LHSLVALPRSLVALPALVALAAVTAPAAAQAQVAADSTVPASAVACDGDTVRAVVVRAERPPFRGHMGLWRRLARSLGLHHSTTREAVIRRFVTLEPGQPCTEFRRAESERLLRAQPFLASATVRTLAEPDGGVTVEVETVDEVPAVFDARLRRGQLAAAMAGNENLFGLGMHAEIRGEQGFAYRDGFGGKVIHRHFLGRPYILGLDAQRHPIGGYWSVSLGHPILTDLQRIAWHAGFARSNRYPALTGGGDSFLALGVRREAWDVGGVLRFGPPGQLWLFGGVVTGERVTLAEAPILITNEGTLPPGDQVRPLPYASHRATRLNVVTGLRALNFTQAQGLDALTATQDIARGVQVGLIAGHGLPAQGDDDLFVAANVFAGFGRPSSYFGVQVDGEARYGNPGRQWDGLLASGRAAWYLKPSAAWTTIASIEAAGGWNVRVPFNLRLDDREGGLRADVDNAFVGTQRVVGRLEQRWIGGQYRRRGDYGLAGFVEAGRLWSGDAPYGRDVPLQTAVGISLLAAVPAGSQRLVRVDVAFPVSGIARRIVEFRFSASDWTRIFWREPSEVERARAGSVLSRIFCWE
jgi:hypothetical protein